jgi:hypothetical protein
MADNDNEPAPVSDGAALLPHVPRELIAHVVVSRIMVNDNGSRAFFVLPRRFSADDDEVTVSEYAGGGYYRAQARDARGRFLAGYVAREFFIDGPAKDVDNPAPRGDATPPAPPAAPVAPVPAPLASLGVPIASPLPGMPTVSLDIPGLSPELRAFLAVQAAQQSYVFQGVMRGTELAVDSARRGADAEREAARHAANLASTFVEKVSGPALANQGEAIRAVSAELATVRAELSSERAAHATTREKWHAQAVEAATLRALLESGGQMPGRTAPGFLGFAERIVGMLITTVGPQFAALVAGQLGIEPDRFKALTAVAGGNDTPGHGTPPAHP